MKKILSLFGSSLIVMFPSGLGTAFFNFNLTHSNQEIKFWKLRENTTNPKISNTINVSPESYKDGITFSFLPQHIPTGRELPRPNYTGNLPFDIFNAFFDPKWMTYLTIILDIYYLHGFNHTPTQTDYNNFTSGWCYQFLTYQFDDHFFPHTPPPEFITWSKKYGQQIYDALKGVESISQLNVKYYKGDGLLQIKKLFSDDAIGPHLIFNSIWHKKTRAHINGVCVSFQLLLAYSLGKYTNIYKLRFKFSSPRSYL